MRLPRRRPQGEARAAGDPPRHHPRRRRHPAARPARRPGQGQGARFVGAEEALAIGLVDEVVDSEEPDAVYQAALARVRPFVGGPAYAIKAAKEAIDRGLETDLETGLEIERMLFASLFATRDREIGMRSFVENGPGKAVFEGA